jgi:hypothetical protein
MARVHVIESAASDPAAAPDFVGQHFIRVDNGKMWRAKGTSVVGDWVLENGTSAFTSAVLGEYKISTNTTPPPATGYIEYNNATQTSATVITINDETQDGIDIDLFLSRISDGTPLVVQDKNDHLNYQIWEVTGTPTDNTSYWSFPVTLVSSGGTGTTNFANNHEIFVAAFGSGSVSDDVYGVSWNGVTAVAPSKNAVYDKIESLSSDIANVNDLVTFTQFGGF